MHRTLVLRPVEVVTLALVVAACADWSDVMNPDLVAGRPIERDGDLTVVFEPGLHFACVDRADAAESPPPMGTYVKDIATCRDLHRGMLVELHGRDSDGTAATTAAVDLTVKPGSSAALAPICQGARCPSVEAPSKDKLTLNDLGIAYFCLVPGALVGNIEVVARSGTLTVEETLQLLPCSLDDDSKLSLTLADDALQELAAARGDLCPPLSPDHCLRRIRTVPFSLLATPAQAPKESPVFPEVVVRVTRGWLDESNCTALAGDEVPTTLRTFVLRQGTATGVWCLGSTAGSGTITATSGRVSDEKTAVAPPVPAAIVIEPVRLLDSSTAELDVVEVSATLLDCQSRPVSGAGLQFQFLDAAAGAIGAPAFSTTDANGRATTQLILDAARRDGRELQVALVGQPTASCRN